MVKKLIGTIALALCVSAFLFSQEATTYQRHQISVNASKFVVLFNEQVNNLDLSYRYSFQKTKRLRLASSIDVSSEEGDSKDYEVRLGYDFDIKEIDRWNFYTGFDLTFGQGINTSSERVNSQYGSYIFLGVLFKMGNHFSLSTEPSLAILGKTRQDPNSFDPDANSSWTEVKLLNIGQIKVGFHF